ncbi:hypothetical protein [Empedobacter falsenii]|uniref:Uncharacterized protein n=1 Tax=Empedobacter falsenii TaxID=343874 RepID=A0AAW7DKR5_9FLAO|nr:hypothetical protein [Empedobacter falsenii]MDM1552623.1 hypothetical protein [Empedobacter falsenii]
MIRRFAFLEQKKSKTDTLEGATREKFYEVESILYNKDHPKMDSLY